MTTATNAILKQPPLPTEVEISLFGPGVGECVVIHLGDGTWIIVDSCINRATKRPMALDYLGGMGIPVKSAVKLVVVTHWHTDHICGADEILKEAVEAKLVISGALQCPQFLQLVGLKHPSGEPKALRTMAELFRIVESRKAVGAVRRGVNLVLAHENTTLLRLPNPNMVEVKSLSPSSATTMLAVQEFSRLMPGYASPVNDIVQGTNEVAVVLHVRAGDRCLLLGADLEINIDSRMGWQAIVGSGERPISRAEVFKVAHHGSVSGHEARVWTEMLTENPHAVLTPYRSAKNPLPTSEDIERIVSLTPDAFITAPPKKKEPPARTRTVDKIVSSNVRGRTVRGGAVGHIRLRAPMNGQAAWRVELFDSAYRLYSAA